MLIEPRQATLDFLRRSHGSRWAKILAATCEKFLRTYYNEGYWNMQRNGEANLIRQFAASNTKNIAIVFDVGSHEGEWTRELLRACPQSRVTCFEILPQIRTRLDRQLGQDQRVVIAQCGLSNRRGSIEVTWNKTFETTNAICPVLHDKYYEHSELELVRCEIETGDEYSLNANVNSVDFLKIDTEGHELGVLLGFSRLLNGDLPPRVIQFEYGTSWLSERKRLSDAYELLEPIGYSVGRLYPDGVLFKDYELADENFRMGNFVAVKKDDALIKLLKL